MRILLALAVALGGVVVTSESADAGHKWRKRHHHQAAGHDRRSRRHCDDVCVRARNLDPAGDYKALPDWARFALSPKNDPSRR